MTTWSVDNDNASVDQNGKVSGLKPGKVTVTAKSNGFTATHEITVLPSVTATEISVSPKSVTLTVGPS